MAWEMEHARGTHRVNQLTNEYYPSAKVTLQQTHSVDATPPPDISHPPHLAASTQHLLH